MKIEAGQHVFFYSKWGQRPAVVNTVNPREQSAMITVEFAGRVHTKKAYFKNLKPIERTPADDDKAAR